MLRATAHGHRAQQMRVMRQPAISGNDVESSDRGGGSGAMAAPTSRRAWHG